MIAEQKKIALFNLLGNVFMVLTRKAVLIGLLPDPFDLLLWVSMIGDIVDVMAGLCASVHNLFIHLFHVHHHAPLFARCQGHLF